MPTIGHQRAIRLHRNGTGARAVGGDAFRERAVKRRRGDVTEIVVNSGAPPNLVGVLPGRRQEAAPAIDTIGERRNGIGCRRRI